MVWNKWSQPSNCDDYIDSRAIIARIEELSDERSDLQTEVDDAQEEVDRFSDEDDPDGNLSLAQEALQSAELALANWDKENEEELRILEEVDASGRDHASDWIRGETLINELVFVEYAKQWAADVGDMPCDIPSWIEIDWDASAENLKEDFTEIDFDWTTFLVRSS